MELSSPLRGRGLKAAAASCVGSDVVVVPLAGTWVESYLSKEQQQALLGSSPLRGRGLKVVITHDMELIRRVVPLAGTRVEINKQSL